MRTRSSIVTGLLVLCFTALTACGVPAEPTCGPGTVLQGNECVIGGVQQTNPLDTLLTGSNVAYGSDEYIGEFPGGRFYKNRIVWTHLALQSAQAWTESGTPLIGSGLALQITGGQPDNEYATTSEPLATLTIESSGSCPNSTAPESYPTDSQAYPKNGAAFGALYSWSNGQATMVRCITAGLVTVQPNSYGAPRGVLLTAQFDDGTVWSDESFALGAGTQ